MTIALSIVLGLTGAIIAGESLGRFILIDIRILGLIVSMVLRTVQV